MRCCLPKLMAIILISGCASTKVDKSSLVSSNEIFQENKKIPKWAKKNTEKRVGKIYYAVGNGKGPSLEIAKNEAINSCRSVVANRLNSHLNMRSLTVETQKDVSFHQELSSNYEVVGLECETVKDELIDINGTFEVWIKCKCEASNAKVTLKDEDRTGRNKKAPVRSGNRSSKIYRNSTLEESSVENYSDQGDTNIDLDKEVSILTIPKCDDIVIVGQQSRNYECNANPMFILIKPSDIKVLLRAKGYKSEEVILNEEEVGIDQIQIIFKN